MRKSHHLLVPLLLSFFVSLVVVCYLAVILNADTQSIVFSTGVSSLVPSSAHAAAWSAADASPDFSIMPYPIIAEIDNPAGVIAHHNSKIS